MFKSYALIHILGKPLGKEKEKLREKTLKEQMEQFQFKYKSGYSEKTETAIILNTSLLVTEKWLMQNMIPDPDTAEEYYYNTEIKQLIEKIR